MDKLSYALSLNSASIHLKNIPTDIWHLEMSSSSPISAEWFKLLHLTAKPRQSHVYLGFAHLIDSTLPAVNLEEELKFYKLRE